MAVVEDIDEDALRKKWSAYQQGDKLAPPPAEAKGRTYTKEQQKTLDSLASVKMCMQCQVAIPARLALVDAPSAWESSPICYLCVASRRKAP